MEGAEAEAEAEAEVEAEAEMGTPGPRGMGEEIVLHAMAQVWEREREGVTRQEVYLELQEEPQQGQLQERPREWRHQVVRLGLAQEAPEREVPAVEPVQDVVRWEREEADMVAVPQEAVRILTVYGG